MSIINKAGQVQRIEDRFHTPFLNEIGGEMSYQVANTVAETSLRIARTQPDAPYVNDLHAIAMAVTQNAAEIGYIQKDSEPLAFAKEAKLGKALVHLFGASELTLGASLNIGQDQWKRMSYHERSTIQKLLTYPSLYEENFPEEPDKKVLQFLDVMDVVGDLDITRALSKAAVLGYLWGNQNLSEVQLVKRSGIDHLKLSPLQPSGCTLEEAQMLRARELEIDVVLRGVQLGDAYTLRVSS